MRISAIFAMSENHVIGDQNKLPWHLPADLRYFKNMTSGKPVVMGRKTFQSIGRPLPNRRNIVMTHDKNFQAPGCEVLHSVDETLSTLKDCEEVFIIGGAQLFTEFFPRVERLYLTLIHKVVYGDTHFPEFEESEWQEVSREDHKADAENQYAYSFITLIKSATGKSNLLF